MQHDTPPVKVASTDQLGPLPAYVYGRECGENEKVWTEAAVRMYGRAAVAVERERCAKLCEQWDATHPARLAAEIRRA